MRVLLLNLLIIVGISFLTSSNAQDFSPPIWNYVPGLKKEISQQGERVPSDSPNEYLIMAIRGDLWDNEIEEWMPRDSVEYSWHEKHVLFEIGRNVFP